VRAYLQKNPGVVSHASGPRYLKGADRRIRVRNWPGQKCKTLSGTLGECECKLQTLSLIPSSGKTKKTGEEKGGEHKEGEGKIVERRGQEKRGEEKNIAFLVVYLKLKEYQFRSYIKVCRVVRRVIAKIQLIMPKVDKSISSCKNTE
jgi:hypothetical protein